MKLGFIGTGKISSSVITGICGSSIKYSKIYISSRNSKIAKLLKKKFKRISIEKDNQKIVDNCNWVFLAVTPTVGKKIIKNLKFRSSQTIVSFISTITLSQLKKTINKRDLIKLIYYMKSDKKNFSDKINLILLKKIGKVTTPGNFQISSQNLHSNLMKII